MYIFDSFNNTYYGGDLTITTFGYPLTTVRYDTVTYRVRSNKDWIPCNEYIALECIVSPDLYNMLTSIIQAKFAVIYFSTIDPRYLYGRVRIVREDGTCIDGIWDEISGILRNSGQLYDDVFLSANEGWSTNFTPPGNTSGVTIGGGVDLGTKDEAYFRSAGISEEIIARVREYFGVRNRVEKDAQGQAIKDANGNPIVHWDATELLTRNNQSEATKLKFTDQELHDITDKVRNKEINALISHYNENKAKTSVAFEKIPLKTRTAVFDTYYQLGPNLIPRTLTYFLHNDWQKLHYELTHFGGTQRRRTLGANLVQNDIDHNRYYPLTTVTADSLQPGY